jgi:hypothetical protein
MKSNLRQGQRNFYFWTYCQFDSVKLHYLEKYNLGGFD